MPFFSFIYVFPLTWDENCFWFEHGANPCKKTKEQHVLLHEALIHCVLENLYDVDCTKWMYMEPLDHLLINYHGVRLWMEPTRFSQEHITFLTFLHAH